LDDILRLTAQLCQEEKENYDKDWDMEWVYGQGKEIIKSDLTHENSFVAVAELDGNVFAFLRGSLYWDGWMSWKKAKVRNCGILLLKKGCAIGESDQSL